MTTTKQRSLILASFLIFSSLWAQVPPAWANPLPQLTVSRGGVSRERPLPVGRQRHNVFGVIATLALPKLLLRTRAGRLLKVDASVAIARGTYSAPLFVGKAVLVAGDYDASGVLHAATVTRMTRIDATTPRDI